MLLKIIGNDEDIMKAIKDYFQSNISLGNIILLAFMAGGFWYVTPQAISANSEKIESHIEDDYGPLQNRVQKNRAIITDLPKDRIVTKGELESLKELVREIQSSQTKQMENLNSRLDYIIQRIDQ